MEIESTKIPLQLQRNEFAFVKLKGTSKIPLEKNWQEKGHTFQDIQHHVLQGNNYGVLGGRGELVIIDADTPVISDLIKKSLPATFTVKSGRGFHYYYLCQDLQQKIILQKDGQHYGDIIANGSQIVGPGSIHPETKQPYLITNNIELSRISKSDILKVFNGYHSLEETPKSISIHFENLVKEYGEPFYLTESGNVTSINQSFWAGLNAAENIQLFEPNEKSFYRYDEERGLYSVISEDVLKQEISKRILEVSRKNPLPSLEKKRTISILNNILAHLKGISEKRHAFNYLKKDFIHLQNGVLKIQEDKTMDLVSFSPEFCSRNQSPIVFQADARCDRFINELLLPPISQEDARLIQKYAGLCLLGDNLIQRFLILGGEAGQGKSQISIVLQELIGLQNVTELRTQFLSERFELYRYLKKTLLVGVDVPSKFLMQKGAYVLKGLTGGDWFDAEKKNNSESFQMKGNYCIVITTNSKLHVQLEGDINAWRRRLLLVEYNHVVQKKKIPNFGKLLIKEEGSGILNWALAGLKILLNDIHTTGDIVLSSVQKGRIDALLEESDSLRHFLRDNLTLSPSNDITVGEIEEAYANYCPAKKWNPKSITVLRKELAELMLEIFGKTQSHSIKRQIGTQRGFRGVAFKEEVPNES